MSEFRFEFNPDLISNNGDNTEFSAVAGRDDQKQECKEEPVPLRPAKEILVTDEDSDETCYEDLYRTLSVTAGDVTLWYLHPEDLEASLQRGDSEATQDIEHALSAHSDLVPCVYEGGLKVWECSLDLVQYMADQRMTFSGKRVLELGCGAGLPGLYALWKGADVHFQDYNEEALLLMTIPNVQLNSKQESLVERSRFFAGDWSLVQRLIGAEKYRYDVILTSETIYSLASQPRLYNIIKRLIKPTGKVYLAAKTHYFGVGGGTRQFEEFVREKGEFEIKPCRVIAQGVQREILEMKFLPKKSRDKAT